MKKYFSTFPLLFMVVVFFFLGIARLNDLSLYTDSTRYLAWGNSIAHGQGFVDDTQPVPEYYVVNAPLYSIVLAPVLILFPMSLIAAKIWTLLWGVLSIILFYFLMKRMASDSAALLATAMFAFNPLTLTLFTEVLSEAPFLCILFSLFFLLEQRTTTSTLRWQTPLLVILLGVVALLREVGAAFVAAAIVFLFFKNQRKLVLISSVTVCFLFGSWTYRNLHVIGTPATSQSANVSYIFQHFVTAPDTPIVQEFLQRLMINVQWYRTELGGSIFYLFPTTFIVHPSWIFTATASFVHTLSPFLWIAILPLCVFGIVLDLRLSTISYVRLLFILLYLSILLFYPVNDVRFLLPLLPFYVWYGTLALQRLFATIPLQAPLRNTVVGCVFAAVLFPNILSLIEMTRTNITYARDPLRFSSEASSWHSDYFSTPWHLLGPWIKQHVPPNTVIATTNKSIAAYAPDQKFLEISRAVPLPQFEQLLRDNAAEYILAPLIADSIHEHQAKMNESTRFRFECVYTIGRLALFQIAPRVPVIFAHAAQQKIPIQLHNDNSLYALARQSILNEQYAKADSLLLVLRLRYKHAAIFTGDLQYQQLILQTFMLDSIRAMQDLQQLYSLPTASSFVDPAHIHIHIMNLILQARRTPSTQQHAMLLYAAGRSCWDIGYSNQAYRLLQESVMDNREYFEGNLWVWYFAMQLGKPQQAAQYLHQLDAIDPSNTVVRCFHRIALLQDSLQQEHSSLKRSARFASLATEYTSLDLPDAAFDAANAALSDDSTNREAAAILLSLFQQRQCLRAANQIALRYHLQP
ncbi:MAG TPA: glycosyltransferase family 39 protein [Bacteroidota bacterium]|nr:glycosyltransferase family 39 protein [Bacteroidota bacterium]